MREDFKDILDDCLYRITTGGESIEQCLESYPDCARELEPLLRAAASTKDALSKEPDREFLQAAKTRFLYTLAHGKEKGKYRMAFWGWHRRWAMAVVAVLALVIMCGGTMGASTNALPGDLLYPVKMATEKIQAFFTFGSEAKAELYLKLAERRVDEIEALAEKHQDIPESVLFVMNSDTDNALSLTDRNGSSKGDLINRIVDLTSNQMNVLARMVKDAPAEAKKVIWDAIRRAEITHNRAETIKARLIDQDNRNTNSGIASPSPEKPSPTGAESSTQSGTSISGTVIPTPSPSSSIDVSVDTPASSSNENNEKTEIEETTSVSGDYGNTSTKTSTPPQSVNTDTSLNNTSSFGSSDEEPSNGGLITPLPSWN